MNTDEKQCPMCAETVKAAAKICRHCRHEFPGPNDPSEERAGPEDPALTGALMKVHPALSAARWVPFILVVLMVLGSIAHAPFATVIFALLAAFVFPPSFRKVHGNALLKVGVALVVFIIGMSIFGAETPSSREGGGALSQKPSSAAEVTPERDLDPWTKRQKEAVFACRALIQQNLRDPTSVDWMGLADQGQASRNGADGYSVIQQVRANNGFGGKTVATYVCKTHPGEGKWVLDDLQELD